MDEVSRAIHTIKRHQQEGQAIRELLNGGQNVVILRTEDIRSLSAMFRLYRIGGMGAERTICAYCNGSAPNMGQDHPWEVEHDPDCPGIRIQNALNSALSFKSSDLESKSSR